MTRFDIHRSTVAVVCLLGCNSTFGEYDLPQDTAAIAGSAPVGTGGTPGAGGVSGTTGSINSGAAVGNTAGTSVGGSANPGVGGTTDTGGDPDIGNAGEGDTGGTLGGGSGGAGGTVGGSGGSVGGTSGTGGSVSGSGGGPVRVDPPACTSDSCECGNGIDDDGDGLVDWQEDLGCTSREDASEGGLATGTIENGWTVVEPSADTRVVYVSSSVGDDALDGLSPEPNGGSGPKRTLNAANKLLRNGSPDWMLLRRGDSWDEGINFPGAGRSATEPMVIASYGESLDRPRINGAALVRKANAMLLHLDLRLPQNNSQAMIDCGGSGNVVVEGNRVEGGVLGVSVAGDDNQKMTHVQIRRNVVISPLNSGFYFSSSHDLLAEDNVIYKPALTNASHGMYITRHGNEGIVTRGNLVYMAKPQGNGIMQRPGGLSEGNVVVESDWTGITMGSCNDSGGSGDSCEPPVAAEIRGNLVVDGRSASAGGIGLDGDYVVSGALIKDNIAHRAPVQSGGVGVVLEGNMLLDSQLSLAAKTGMVWRNNQVLVTKDSLLVAANELPAAKPFTAQGNRFFSSVRDPNSWFQIPQKVGFSGWKSATGETGSGDAFEVADAGVSLAAYDESIDGAGNNESFFQGALLQAKFRYADEYGATAVIKYFRDGLTMK